jgi:Fic-DOC domain mobile mystery protein B
VDPSFLKDRSIRTRQELNRAEANNIRKAYVKYLVARPKDWMAPFDYAWFLRLHQEMYCDVWRWAGEPRTVNLNMGCPWTQIPEQLALLAQDLRYWEASPNWRTIDGAARLHYRAVTIHPFYNGNGRWARLLANIWLFMHEEPVTAWPEQEIGRVSPARKDYLDTLREADNGKSAPLIAIHLKYAARE